MTLVKLIPFACRRYFAITQHFCSQVLSVLHKNCNMCIQNCTYHKHITGKLYCMFLCTFQITLYMYRNCFYSILYYALFSTVALYSLDWPIFNVNPLSPLLHAVKTLKWESWEFMADVTFQINICSLWFETSFLWNWKQNKIMTTEMKQWLLHFISVPVIMIFFFFL